jgi:glutamyl-tRNA reductase
MHGLLLTGLNHLTAPLELRERLALSPDDRAALRQALSAGGGETVVLNTCNRIEIYQAAPAPPDGERVLETLASLRGIPMDRFLPHVYVKRGRDAIEHVFAVACGLESMVIGETQILGQLREAYDESLATGTTGPILNPLLQRALAVGREVITRTALAEGRTSVASVAVDYARQIFEGFADKTVLTIGAGKMARLVLRRFAELHPQRLVVASRDVARASALAAEFGGAGASLDDLDRHLVEADVVITSTGSATPIITRPRFEPLVRTRRFRPIFLIDIALPRDIDPGVGELPSVYLYNLEDLQRVVAQTVTQRGDAIAEARRIVRGGVEAFLSWNRQRTLGPVIDRLYRHYHALAEQELQRTLAKFPDIGAAEREHLVELSRRIVNKLLHEPVRNLRNAGGGEIHASPTPYVHALEKLFALDRFDDSDGIPPMPPTPSSNPDDADERRDPA